VEDAETRSPTDAPTEQTRKAHGDQLCSASKLPVLFWDSWEKTLRWVGRRRSAQTKGDGAEALICLETFWRNPESVRGWRLLFPRASFNPARNRAAP